MFASERGETIAAHGNNNNTGRQDLRKLAEQTAFTKFRARLRLLGNDFMMKGLSSCHPNAR